MKKILAALLIVLALAACGKKSEPVADNTPTITNAQITIVRGVLQVDSATSDIIYVSNDGEKYHFAPEIMNQLKTNGIENYSLETITAKTTLKEFIGQNGNTEHQKYFIDFVLPTPSTMCKVNSVWDNTLKQCIGSINIPIIAS